MVEHFYHFSSIEYMSTQHILSIKTARYLERGATTVLKMGLLMTQMKLFQFDDVFSSFALDVSCVLPHTHTFLLIWVSVSELFFFGRLVNDNQSQRAEWKVATCNGTKNERESWSLEFVDDRTFLAIRGPNEWMRTRTSLKSSNFIFELLKHRLNSPEISFISNVECCCGCESKEAEINS